jgi:regulator of nucleoside diphosphate kinase
MQGSTQIPKIIVGSSDHQQLSELALAGSGKEVADDLLDELGRAKVLDDAELPTDVVRMGSTVRYRANGGAEREVTLVYPADADIAEGKISVLTPVGTALIGLSTGQSIDWSTRDGRKQVLTVTDVRQPQ